MKQCSDKKLNTSDLSDDIDLKHEEKMRERDKLQFSDLLKTEDRILSMGERATKYRILANYTLNEVSRILDIPRNAIIEMETNNQVLSMKKANELAALLNIEPSLLFLSKEEIQKLKFADLLNTEDELLSMGERARKYRILANYTLSEISKKLDISRNSIVGMENDNQFISVKKSNKLATLLNVEHSLLFLSKEERQKEKFAKLLETEDELLTVGERIRKYRIKADYTLQSFSKKVDIALTSLGGIEKNYYNLSKEKAEIFAKALKIDVSLIYMSKIEKEKKKSVDILEKDDSELSLGEYIKKHRILNGYTVDAFAEEIGISVAYLGKVENNEHLIAYEKAIKISELLKIDVDMISVTEEEKQKQKFADLLNTEDTLLSVGERIRKYRIINDYTLKEFATKCNIADTHLCNIEGEKSKASSKLTQKFADILNIDVSLLIKNIDKSNYKTLGRKKHSIEQEKKILCKKYSKLIQTEDNLLSPGELIKKYRVLNGYSLKNMSKEIDITGPYLSEIEKDKHNISYEYAKKIADLLGLDVSLLSKTEAEKLREKYSKLLKTDDSLLLIGERIKKYRILKGYSLIALSKELGITGPYLIEVEKSNRFLASEKIASLVVILGIDSKLVTPTEKDIQRKKSVLTLQTQNYSINSKKKQEQLEEFLKTEDSLLTIGEIIKKYRIINNHTLKSLSKEVNITYSYLGQIERNKLDLSISKTKELATVLGIDAALITLDEIEKQKQKHHKLLQTENDSLSIGERIKKYRIQNNCTLTTFSEQCDITKSHLGKIESNKSVASLKLTKKIADVLQIDYTLIYMSEEEFNERRSSYISKIGEKRIEKHSDLLNSDDTSLAPGECVRKYRLINKLTLKELSQKIGVSCSNLSEFEMGKREIAQADADRAAKILNIDLSLIYR